MRLVGNGLGKSRGSGGSLPSSHTRLPSLKKGKERVRELLGERRGVPEGDVRLGSAMSDVTRKRRRMGEDGVDAVLDAAATPSAAGCCWTADTAVCPLVYL